MPMHGQRSAPPPFIFCSLTTSMLQRCSSAELFSFKL
jgi:hypothetical protein